MCTENFDTSDDLLGQAFGGGENLLYDSGDIYETDTFMREDLNGDSNDDSECGFLHEKQSWGENNSFVPSFSRREDMFPYDESLNSNLLHRALDPFGIYTMRHSESGFSTEDHMEKPDLPVNFTNAQLQDACNTICDSLHLGHIPVFVTSEVPNAAHCDGFFQFTTVDDSLYLNPDYAQTCINQTGSTDIVLSDMGHEIGHAIATKYCGHNGTYMDEKIADFISGFVNCKLGVDIDSARQWFQWHYDPDGNGGYPISEERWDIESAGYYYGHLANAEDLKNALGDPGFLNIIENYNSDTSLSLAQDAYNQDPYASQGTTDNVLGSMLTKIKSYLHV